MPNDRMNMGCMKRVSMDVLCSLCVWRTLAPGTSRCLANHFTMMAYIHQSSALSTSAAVSGHSLGHGSVLKPSIRYEEEKDRTNMLCKSLSCKDLKDTANALNCIIVFQRQILFKLALSVWNFNTKNQDGSNPVSSSSASYQPIPVHSWI